MNLLWLLFSFRGRIGRAKYWLWLLGFSFAFGFFFAIFLRFFRPPEEHINTILMSSLFFYATLLYISAALGVKRLHDREKSGWWILLFLFGPTALSLAAQLAMHTVGELVTLNLIAIVGSLVLGIWGLIELGFLRGTSGPNRFGADPIVPAPSEPISIQPGLA